MLELVIDGVGYGLPALALLGVGVGFLAGMFGVGGGFLLVPLMHVLLGIPIVVAVAAGLCQTIATGSGSLLRYRSMGLAEVRFDVLLLGGSFLGVGAGTRLLDALSQSGTLEVAGRDVPTASVVVTGLYVLLFSVMAFLLWSRSGDGRSQPGPLARIRIPPMVHLPLVEFAVSGPVVAWIGFANGVLAGLLGIGGGIVLIPIMLYGFGFDIRKVAGTGVLVVLVVAIVGTVGHVRLGNVHLGLACTLMIGSAIAAQFGASVTRSVSPQALRRGLAVVLVVANGLLLFRLFG